MLWLVLSRREDAQFAQRMCASTTACAGCSGSDFKDNSDCPQGMKQSYLCSPILFNYFISEVASGIIRGGNYGI